jgi:Zn ribbon nucleic-acid-binding protein
MKVIEVKCVECGGHMNSIWSAHVGQLFECSVCGVRTTTQRDLVAEAVAKHERRTGEVDYDDFEGNLNAFDRKFLAEVGIAQYYDEGE